MKLPKQVNEGKRSDGAANVQKMTCVVTVFCHLNHQNLVSEDSKNITKNTTSYVL